MHDKPLRQMGWHAKIDRSERRNQRPAKYTTSSSVQAFSIGKRCRLRTARGSRPGPPRKDGSVEHFDVRRVRSLKLSWQIRVSFRRELHLKHGELAMLRIEAGRWATTSPCRNSSEKD